MSFRRIALIILLIVVVISLSLLAWKVISDDNNQEAIAGPTRSEIVFSDTDTSTQTGADSLTGALQEEKKPVLIAIPDRFASLALEQAVETHDVRLIILPQEEYHERALGMRKKGNIDLALVDSLVVEDFRGEAFVPEFDDTIQDVFAPFVHTLLQQGLVPHAADPLVFVSNPSLLLKPERYTLEQRDEYINQLIQEQESDLPLVGAGYDHVLGLMREKERQLGNDAFFFALYELMKQRHNSNDIYALRNFMDRPRDTRAVSQALSSSLSDQGCDIFCLIDQGDMWIAPSRYHQWSFAQQQGDSAKTLLGFPDYTKNMPVRTWQRVIHNNPDELIPRLLVINDIIKAGDLSGQHYMPLHRQALSAWLLQQDHIGLKGIDTLGSLMLGGRLWQKNFILYSGIKDVLSEGYNPQLWLENPSRDF